MNTTLNQNRSLNLFIVVGIAVALIAVLVFASPAAVVVPAIPQNAAEDQSRIGFAPLSADAFPEYHQSEWASVIVPVTGEMGIELYQQSERTLIPAVVDFSAYHLSERTLVDPKAGFAMYLLSERTLVDPQVGMAMYLNSERTSIPVRDIASFNAYQRSEWFGK